MTTLSSSQSSGFLQRVLHGSSQIDDSSSGGDLKTEEEVPNDHLHSPQESKERLKEFKAAYESNLCPKTKLDEFEVNGVIADFEPTKYRCKHLRSGKTYMMILIYKCRFMRKCWKKVPQRAKKIQFALQSPFAAKLHFVCQSAQNLFMFVDYAEFGSLSDIIHDRDHRLPEDEIRLFAAQLVLAIEFLHAARVVHRGIQARNIFMYSDGYLKIGNFLHAKKLKNDTTQTIGVWDTHYLAPEMVLRKPYSFGIDWWALGVVIYEMFHGDVPFASRIQKKLESSIVSAEYEFGRCVDRHSIALIKKLLEVDPEKRRAEGIKDETWFESLDWEKVYRKGYEIDTLLFKKDLPVKVIERKIYDPALPTVFRLPQFKNF